jgi:hypothetical protein
MIERELILAHCIEHVCQTGYCSGTHGPGLLEFPSLIFVEACAQTLAQRTEGAGPLAPD